MPRGVPKSGVRMTQKRMRLLAGGGKIPAKLVADAAAPIHFAPDSDETDAEITQRLNERFEILDMLTSDAVDGDASSLIVSGPPGLGKSFTVEQRLKKMKEGSYGIVRGKVLPTGLYKMLYRFRKPGQVLAFDDADRTLMDEDSLTMLKAVCDTLDERVVSNLTEYKIIDEVSLDVLPTSFVFEGSIIFITNLDFDDLIERGNKIGPHLEAMVSRSHYIDLSMKSKRDYMIRIHQIAPEMLKGKGLGAKQIASVMDFIDKHSDDLRELSLRIAIKIGALAKKHKHWEKMARVTCCRGIS